MYDFEYMSTLDFANAEYTNAEVVTECIKGTAGDKECMVLDKDHTSININFSSEFKAENFDGSEYTVNISYFDTEEGYIAIYYDTYKAPNRFGEIIYTKGTNKWKTASFLLSDADFKNRVDEKYDMKISVTAKSTLNSKCAVPMYIDKMLVIRDKAVNKLFPTYKIDESGNTFSWYAKEKKIHITLENISDGDVKAAAMFSLYNFEGKSVLDKAEEISVKKGEKLNLDLDIGEITLCNTYKLGVRIMGEDFASAFLICELAIIKTDENGILNKEVYICAHLEKYRPERTLPAVDLLRRANIGGIRLEIRWRLLEQEKGVLDWDNHPAKPVYDALCENGLGCFALLWGGCPAYGMEDGAVMPETDEEIEAFGRFVEYMTKVFGNNVTRYEIWNEPNMTGFNHKRADGYKYAKLVKTAADIIHKANPKNKVSAFCLTYLGLKEENDRTRLPREYFLETAEGGACDCVDAIAIHPYGGIDSLEKRRMEDIVGWYKEQFIKYSGKVPEMWNTELGYSTHAVSEDTKGIYNSRSSVYLKSRNLAEFNCFYNFAKKGVIDFDREDQFGMTLGAPFGTERYGAYHIPTRSFVMLAGHNYCMADTTTDGIYDCDNENVRITKFKSGKFKANVVVLNTVTENRRVTLNLGCNNITLYDCMGNGERLASDDGVYTFCATDYPVYIVGHIDNVEVKNIE